MDEAGEMLRLLAVFGGYFDVTRTNRDGARHIRQRR